MSQIGSNKTIAKNTIFLYLRSFMIMAVSLYTSRIILQALGVNDYGLYGAIGSIVAMFALLNGVLSAGTSRFLTFELGKGDYEKLRKTFSASFTMHVCLAVILFLLLETVGLWFVNHKLNIPAGREFAANMVYQLSIVTSMLTLTQVPYSACIIAHERMNIYAYVGLAEVFFKLALVAMLLWIPFSDNLIAYAIILSIWSIGLQLWYRFYCSRNFEECHLMIVKDKSIYKDMLSYSLWDFVGQFCATGNSQGLNVLLNMFFGVTINAARAVAFQVETAVTQFSSNFLTAVNPQITKSYAQGDYNRFLQLVTHSSRLSFYLLFMISLPFFLEANYILKLWLVEVPETSVSFLRFALYYGVFRVVMRPFVTGTHATGKIKYLNLTGGLYSALTFLSVIYFSYKLGAPYWACFVVQGVNGVVLTYFEMTSLHKTLSFSRVKMMYSIMIKPWFICLVASIPSIFICSYFEESFFRLMATGIFSLLCIISAAYCFGLEKKQKETIKSFIISKIRKS